MRISFRKIKYGIVAVVFWTVWFAISLTAPSIAGTSQETLHKAKVLSQQGDWDGAIREFEKALRENPDDSS